MRRPRCARSRRGTRLVHVPLYDESMSVVVAHDHSLARRANIRVGELHRLEWIVPTQDSVAYPSVRAFFEKEGLSVPRRRVESVSILTNLGLLARRPMVALMPQSVATRLVKAGLIAMLPLPSLGPVGTIGYTLHSRRTRDMATEHLLNALHEVGDELQQVA